MYQLFQIKITSRQTEFSENGKTSAEFYREKVRLIKKELEPLTQLLEDLGFEQEDRLNPIKKVYRKYKTKPIVIAPLIPEEKNKIYRLPYVNSISFIRDL